MWSGELSTSETTVFCARFRCECLSATAKACDAQERALPGFVLHASGEEFHVPIRWSWRTGGVEIFLRVSGKAPEGVKA